MQYTSLNDRTYRGILEGARVDGPYQGKINAFVVILMYWDEIPI